MRDNEWLAARLENLWATLFPDVMRPNTVRTRFKGRWKNKFGHIKRLKNKDTEIAINGLFANETIPEYIIDLTLAHEITHYSHGFNSPLPRKYRHPHAGGIVRRELKARGLGALLRMERHFVKNEWRELYKKMRSE